MVTNEELKQAFETLTKACLEQDTVKLTSTVDDDELGSIKTAFLLDSVQLLLLEELDKDGS